MTRPRSIRNDSPQTFPLEGSRMRKTVGVVALAFVLLSPPLAWADTVYFDSGYVARGVRVRDARQQTTGPIVRIGRVRGLDTVLVDTVGREPVVGAT